MSQYPYPSGPYGYPGGFNPALDQALAPARRASVVMFILGGFLLLFTLCCGVGAVIPWDELSRQQPEIADMLNQNNLTAQQMRIAFAVMAVGLGVAGILLIVLGVFVRRGGVAMAVTSIVLTSLLVLMMLVWLAQVVGETARNPQAAPGICLVLIPLVLLVLQLVWLIQAAKKSGDVRALRLGMPPPQTFWNQGGYDPMYYQYGPPPAEPPAPPTEPPDAPAR